MSPWIRPVTLEGEIAGAREEGTLRHHMIRPDGSFRDSVYFGIVRDEWPEVEARLLGFLEGRSS